MRCSACGTDSPPTARFCAECGARLADSCTQCGAEVGPTAKYCHECGARLGTALSSSAASVAPSPESHTPRHLAEKILASRDALTGERTQVTVLFADIAGSTGLIEGLDTEEAQRLLDGAVRVMMDAVHRFEGTVSRVMGDGLMALFGAPIAHEDHAVRACYAALTLQDGMRRYADEVRRTKGVEVEARVGLNSGEVIVRLIADDLHMDYTAMGQTVHLASRLEQLASGGTTVLSPSTLALVTGYVDVRSLGPVPIRGVTQPVETYRLVGTGLARTRSQAAAARGLTRLAGRDAEVAALYTALERAGAVVTVVTGAQRDALVSWLRRAAGDRVGALESRGG
jgi:class 3 adenylate cyclase